MCWNKRIVPYCYNRKYVCYIGPSDIISLCRNLSRNRLSGVIPPLLMERLNNESLSMRWFLFIYLFFFQNHEPFTGHLSIIGCNYFMGLFLQYLDKNLYDQCGWKSRFLSDGSMQRGSKEYFSSSSPCSHSFISSLLCYTGYCGRYYLETETQQKARYAHW